MNEKQKKRLERTTRITFWNLVLVVIFSATGGAILTLYDLRIAWGLIGLCVVLGLFYLSETEAWKRFKGGEKNS